MTIIFPPTGTGEAAEERWCRANFLSRHSLRTIADLREQFLGLLEGAGLVGTDTFDRGGNARQGIGSPGSEECLVRACLAAGLFPKVT